MKKVSKIAKSLGARMKKKSDKSVEYFFTKARMADKQKFSFSKVRGELVSMIELIDDDSISNKHAQFFEKFLDLYLQVYADDHSGSAKIHPSSFMHACERAVYYELDHYEVTEPRPPIDIGLQKIFDIGTFWHTYLQAYLKKAGVLKASEVIVRSRRKHIDGRADGVLIIETNERLLEIKTINTFTFGKLKEPIEEHKFQASLYASELGIKVIHFVYIEKNFGQFKEFVVKVDRAYVHDANEKIKVIKQHLKAGTPPMRVCEDIEEEDACNCPYKTQCFIKHKKYE